MINVLLSFLSCSHLVLILFPFPLTPTESIVFGLPKRVGAANMDVLLFFYLASILS